MAQVAAVVPGGAGPVHRHLPHIHHTACHDLIGVGLQHRQYDQATLQVTWACLCHGLCRASVCLGKAVTMLQARSFGFTAYRILLHAVTMVGGATQ